MARRSRIGEDVRVMELVVYDPDDPDTYPSVCQHKEEVKDRFGFEGGETLVFDAHGSYLGQLVKQLGLGVNLG